ncbi:MAG: Fe-S cluster protein [Nanoarchaeota archaeon]|nr:Fe-S cluster protein [Nanoarchaeota archaeon]|tara:strand:- start:415 stop:756 length:342 start_codon:yes stop_codon:yes gene_type:complete
MNMYKENIVDHYKNPRNKKEMSNATHSHAEHNPLCGDTITIFMNEKEVTFTGEGCAISQASASLLTEFLKGKSMEDVKNITEEKVYELLGIPISHARRKCALLPLFALRGALC